MAQKIPNLRPCLRPSADTHAGTRTAEEEEGRGTGVKIAIARFLRAKSRHSNTTARVAHASRQLRRSGPAKRGSSIYIGYSRHTMCYSLSAFSFFLHKKIITHNTTQPQNQRIHITPWARGTLPSASLPTEETPASWAFLERTSAPQESAIRWPR